MAIRFVCPSCQQPLEIDDQWASQSVACPYCNRVVTAPATSTWTPGQQVPVASAPRPSFEGARSAFDPPPPPAGSRAYQQPVASTSSAWATAMTLAGLGFILVSMVTWSSAASPVLIGRLGPPPTVSHSDAASREAQSEYQRKAYELIQSGAIPAPGVTTAAVLLGLACSLAGLILSIKVIVQGTRRGRGVVLAMLSFICLGCEGLITFSLVVISTAAHMKG